MSGQQSSTTPNGSGHLKDFGEQDDPWVTAFSDRILGTRWPGWRWGVDEFVIGDDHKIWTESCPDKRANSCLALNVRGNRLQLVLSIGDSLDSEQIISLPANCIVVNRAPQDCDPGYE